MPGFELVDPALPIVRIPLDCVFLDALHLQGYDKESSALLDYFRECIGNRRATCSLYNHQALPQRRGDTSSKSGTGLRSLCSGSNAFWRRLCQSTACVADTGRTNRPGPTSCNCGAAAAPASEVAQPLAKTSTRRRSSTAHNVDALSNSAMNCAMIVRDHSAQSYSCLPYTFTVFSRYR